jgi:alcohol dehydrogenase
MDFACAVTARGGTTVSAGLPRPDAAIACLDAAMVADERTIKAAASRGAISRASSICTWRGKLPVDRLHAGDLKFEGC